MHTINAQQNFLGPLFIVGMPRSGTTLLRALLNQHPRISLARTESHFIPYFVKIYGDPPSLDTQAKVELFIKRFHQTVFYRTLSQEDYRFETQDLYQHAHLDSWASIFETILRHFSSKPDQHHVIWGDKTPGYLNHIPLLKRLYPEARFLHIIRDPRDYCLSAKLSWGKNIYRAAHRWQATMSRARQEGHQLGRAYLEITYESLITDTANVMKHVATFLECDYHPDMSQIGLSPENTGSTTGKYGIAKDNMNKYRQSLSQRQINRIEEIVCNCTEKLGYQIENNVRYRPLSPLQLCVYKLFDGLPTLKHNIALSTSVFKGVGRCWALYRTSSWR